jgi:hypothetical protein
MLSKSQIVDRLVEMELGQKRHLSNVLAGLAEIAADEVALGEDFTVPGIASLRFAYTSPRAKGAAYKKGETYVGFGGVEQVAEADSKPRKASVKLRATPAAPIKRLAPSKDGQAAFLKTRAGKNIVSRKAR